MSAYIEPFPLLWPTGWPRTAESKRMPQFKFKGLTHNGATRSLVEAVRKLGGRNLVITTNLRVRQDGLPYAQQARMDDPGVAIYFDITKAGAVQHVAMARDAYQTIAANARSLALALDYMRGMERHGGAVMVDRMFTGFTALPEPGRKAPWREVFGFTPGEFEANHPDNRGDIIEMRFRKAAMERHPDRGGSDAAMAELNEAREQALREIGSQS